MHDTSNLEIVGVCKEDGDEQGETIYTLHIIGRTRGEPHRYYYRKYQAKVDPPGVWLPWESIDVDIQGDVVFPQIMNGRLYLLWPQYMMGQRQVNSGTTSSGEGVRVTEIDFYTEIKVAWCYFNGKKWTGVKTTKSVLSDISNNSLDFQLEDDEKINDRYHFKAIIEGGYISLQVYRTLLDIDNSWKMAQEGGRAGAGKVIVEGFVDFDYEITLLTVRHKDGTSFLNPVGHWQKDGDYQESWQPQPMSDVALAKAQDIAKKITDALGGRGIFGVEMFIKGDDVIFSEVSPRPHDTGMVTMISQDLSEFALHVRAILGLPIPNIAFHGPSASKAVVVFGDSTNVSFSNLEEVLAEPDTQIRIFGKPEVHEHRRMAVLLARGNSIEDAKAKVRAMYDKLKVEK